MSTKTFKAGDRVRCVNSSDAFPLTTGAEYTVGRSFPHPDYADLPLLDLDGVNRGGRIGFRADRFELIKAGVPGAVGQRVRFVKNYEPFGIAAGDTGTIVLNDNTLCPYKIRIDRRLPYPWGNGLIWMRAENVELLPRIEAAKPLPGGFKAGDKVRLKPGVALWGPVKPGVTYVVSEERADIANMIRIKDEKGNKAGGWEASKFEKVPAQVAFLERYEVLLRDLHHPIFAPRVYPPAGLADFSYIKAPYAPHIVVLDDADEGAVMSLKPSTRPVVHRSEAAAEAEAVRLSKENPGKRFIVFRAAVSVRQPPANFPPVQRKAF
jgi:hypothetical protein